MIDFLSICLNLHSLTKSALSQQPMRFVHVKSNHVLQDSFHFLRIEHRAAAIAMIEQCFHLSKCRLCQVGVDVGRSSTALLKWFQSNDGGDANAARLSFIRMDSLPRASKSDENLVFKKANRCAWCK